MKLDNLVWGGVRLGDPWEKGQLSKVPLQGTSGQNEEFSEGNPLIANP